MIYEFTISRPDASVLRYEAYEERPSQGLTFSVRSSPLTAGSYPEVDQHLLAAHGLSLTPGAAYDRRLGDTFDQATGTWTYNRGSDQIIVHDVPRTVAEIGRF